MSLGKDRLKQLRNSLGMSQPVFSQHIGINNSTVNHIENGNQKLSVKVALVLREKITRMPDGRLRIVTPEEPRKSDEAQLRMEWLLTGEGEPFEKLLAGIDIFALEYGDTIIKLPHGRHIELYNMPDNTMYPEFAKNDLIAINKDETDIVNGGVYLISVFGDSVLRQIFKVGKNKLNVVAANKDLVPSFEINETDIKVVGKYVYSLRIPH